MIRKLQTIIVAIILIATPFVAMPAFAYDPVGSVCNNAAAKSSSLCQGLPKNPNVNPLTGPNGLIHGIANLVALVAGIAAVIVIVIAGFRYVTSGGDAAKAKNAKDTIVGAVIGLVVIALAAEIIAFVISKI